MNTLIKNEKQSNTFDIPRNTSSFKEKVNGPRISIDSKFYQKLLVIFISLSTILIFPEKPKELESICMTYYSRNICNFW